MTPAERKENEERAREWMNANFYAGANARAEVALVALLADAERRGFLAGRDAAAKEVAAIGEQNHRAFHHAPRKSDGTCGEFFCQPYEEAVKAIRALEPGGSGAGVGSVECEQCVPEGRCHEHSDALRALDPCVDDACRDNDHDMHGGEGQDCGGSGGGGTGTCGTCQGSRQVVMDVVPIGPDGEDTDISLGPCPKCSDVQKPPCAECGRYPWPGWVPADRSDGWVRCPSCAGGSS